MNKSLEDKCIRKQELRVHILDNREVAYRDFETGKYFSFAISHEQDNGACDNCPTLEIA